MERVENVPQKGRKGKQPIFYVSADVVVCIGLEN